MRNGLSSRSTIMPRTWIALLLLVACVFSTTSRAQTAAATPPDTPAGHTLSAWLEAMNTADQAQIRHYVDYH